MDTDHGTLRSEAEENFKAQYGHYPIRVELPEPPHRTRNLTR
jgi:hypothetical protein